MHVMRERGSESLAGVLRVGAQQHGHEDAVLQVHPVDRDLTVVRVRSGPQVWRRVAVGMWTIADVDALVDQGLVVRMGITSLGHVLTPRPELLGAC